MIKIIFVIPAMNLGGAEKSLVELLNIMDYKKYEVDLLLLEGEGILLSQVNPAVNILHKDVICSAFLKNLTESVELLLKYRKVGLAIKRVILSGINKVSSNINISHLTWRMLKEDVNFVAKKYDYAIAYLQGIPEYYVIEKIKAYKKIFWMHTSFKYYSKNNRFEKEYVNQYDKIVCVSEAAKKDFINLFPNKEEQIQVVYNIIDKEKIKKLAIERNPIPQDSNFHIVSVGRLHEAKGYDIAIRAFKKLHDMYPDVCLHIVGEGPLKEKLRKQIKENNLDNVCLLEGKTVNPYCYMRQADIILQSSRYEGYCIVLAEAKTLCKPIVTTDFFGAREQIKDYTTGMIVKCTEESIYKSLKKMYENPNLRNVFAYNLMKEENRIENTIDQIFQ